MQAIYDVEAVTKLFKSHKQEHSKAFGAFIKQGAYEFIDKIESGENLLSHYSSGQYCPITYDKGIALKKLKVSYKGQNGSVEKFKGMG